MVVTRFAPSPTGFLHIGGLRTALFSYLWAKRNKGKFLLRIEDTDKARNSEEAAQAILEAFGWLGMQPDDEVVYQSKRDAIYRPYIEQLLKEGKAYYCYMSKEELDALREEQMAAKQTPKYNGAYRDFTGKPPEGIEPVVRLKVPYDHDVVFEDGVKGTNKVNTRDLDDFIIARSDGSPTYNFVVTIDDALMRVSDVIRGDDHLSNTPKQILIYEALGLEVPRFAHVPMIIKDGKKLSKRDGAANVLSYQDEGFLPEALLNYLVRLGWSHGDQEIFSLQEMIDDFDPKDLNTSASQLNEKKLLWLNAHYIKNTPSKDLLVLTSGLEGASLAIVDLVKDRVSTIQELRQEVLSITQAPSAYAQVSLDRIYKGGKDEVLQTLEAFVQKLKEQNPTTAGDFEVLGQSFLQEQNLKMVQLGLPLRVALTGSHQAPSIYDLLGILGANEVILRLRQFLDAQ